MSQKNIDTVYGSIFAALYGVLCPATLLSYLYLLMNYRSFLPDALHHFSPRSIVVLAFFLLCLGCYVCVHLWKVFYWRCHEKRLIHTLLEVILPMAMFYPVLMFLSFVAVSFPPFL